MGPWDAFEHGRHGHRAERGDLKYVILDLLDGHPSYGYEIICALDVKLIELDAVLQLIKSAPANVELVLTGRNAPKALIAAADLVSEVREIKHYYRKGIKGRKGIEY